MKKSQRRVLAVVSDVHAGSTVAVCPTEDIALDDGGSYAPSKAQRWLYENWLLFWARVKGLAGTDPIHVLTNGDLVDGDHHGTHQIISRDPAVQMWILKKLFQPVIDLKPASAVVVRGTEAHVGKGASAEEHFARWLHKEGVTVRQEPGTGMYSWWHYRGGFATTVVDAAHHGRMGSRPWTKGGQAHNLAAQIVMESATRNDPIPHLAFRSHYHTFFDTGRNLPTRLIQTPAWQLHTAYAHKVVPEVLSDIGGVIVVLEPGAEPVVEPVLFRPAKAKRVPLD